MKIVKESTATILARARANPKLQNVVGVCFSITDEENPTLPEMVEFMDGEANQYLLEEVEDNPSMYVVAGFTTSFKGIQFHDEMLEIFLQNGSGFRIFNGNLVTLGANGTDITFLVFRIYMSQWFVKLVFTNTGM